MLIELIELACNNALEHDAATRQRLTRLNGKIMSLEIKTPAGSTSIGPQSISICPQPHGLEISSEQNDSPDVTLRATLPALLKISRDGMENADLMPGELEINGDAIVGQRFAQVIAELDIDWEGMMAEHIGETPAGVLNMGFGKAKEIFRGSQSVLQNQVSKLLTEDLGLVATKEDVDPFLDDVDTLRADAERLQARLKRIQNSL